MRPPAAPHSISCPFALCVFASFRLCVKLFLSVYSDSRCSMVNLPRLTHGTYILILHLDQPQNLQIGQLGIFPFPAGFYAYVGSAMGSGGLTARLNHHLNISQHPHWHIDYLRRVAPIQQIWFLEMPLRREHKWAQILADLPAASQPVPRFGASDCHCPSHLFHFPSPPSLDEFQHQASRCFPDDKPLTRMML